MGAAGGLGNDAVDHTKAEQVGRGDLHIGGRILGPGRVTPQNGGAAFGRNDRIDGVFEHQHAAGRGNGNRAARAAFADDDGDIGHAQFERFFGGAGNGFGLTALFSANAGIGASGVDERDHRNIEPVGHFHDADGLAIAFRPGHAEIVLEPALGGVAFFLTQNGDRLTIEAAKAGLNGRVFGKLAIASHGLPFGDQRLDVIGEVRPLRMTRDLGLLPGREFFVDFHQRLVGAARQAVDLLVDADGLIGRCKRLELGDLAFKIGYRLFEIEIRLHSTCPLGVTFLDPCIRAAAVAP